MGLALSLTVLLLAGNASARIGRQIANYSFPASSLTVHPTQPYIYAISVLQNSVAIINTNTLTIEATRTVGSGPAGLTFSPDGSKAYIANTDSNSVVVLSTQSRTITNKFLLPERPHAIVFGNQNRLFVLGEPRIFQIDATTGASVGPSIDPNTPSAFAGGFLQISPDRNTLYYAGNGGGSQVTINKYDISGNTPTLLLQTPSGAVGFNGLDLALSHDGNFICFAVGPGQNNYQIAKFRTSDFAVLGYFNTGEFPQAVTFSPDDSIVYASVYSGGGIKVFDADTFQLLTTISGPEAATKLAVDSTGRHLFAGYSPFSHETRVFNTHESAAIDFNHDGKADYVLFNASTRQTAIWYLGGNRLIGGVFGPTLPTGWTIVDIADFDHDGSLDYALFNANTGRTAIWYLDSKSRFIKGAYGPYLRSGWSFVAVGNFDSGNEETDFLGISDSTGETAVAYLSNYYFVDQARGPTVPTNWQLISATDFDLDGRVDFLLFNPATRGTAIWFLDDVNYLRGAGGPSTAPGYRLTGADDFDLDGKPDYVLFNPVTRQTAIWYMNGTKVVRGAYGPTIPAGWSLVRP